MKKAFLKFPEFYFILLVILAGYTPPFSFNPIFIAIGFVFISQIIFKNRITGLLLAIGTGILSLLFLGALLSEFLEFTSFNSKAQQLLFVGLSIFSLNIIATITMFFRYLKTPSKVISNLIVNI